MKDIRAIAIACTLDAANLKERLGWIADLNARSLWASRRDDLVLSLDYEPAALDDVRHMAAGEQACCPFLGFEIAERDGAVRLTITAPEEARESAEALFEAFVTTRDRAPGACGCGERARHE